MSGIAPIKFVAIGGGTGLSTPLQGLKPYSASGRGGALERAFASEATEKAEIGPRIR